MRLLWVTLHMQPTIEESVRQSFGNSFDREKRGLARKDQGRLGVFVVWEHTQKHCELLLIFCTAVSTLHHLEKTFPQISIFHYSSLTSIHNNNPSFTY